MKELKHALSSFHFLADKTASIMEGGELYE